jgi:hypothetical protein
MSFFLNRSKSIMELQNRKAIMGKVPNKQPIPIPGKSNVRIIQLISLPLAIQCTNPGKAGKSKIILISDIREIRRGQNTKAFELFGKSSLLEDRSFSIIFYDGVKYATLNLGKLSTKLIISCGIIFGMRNLGRWSLFFVVG